MSYSYEMILQKQSECLMEVINEEKRLDDYIKEHDISTLSYYNTMKIEMLKLIGITIKQIDEKHDKILITGQDTIKALVLYYSENKSNLKLIRIVDTTNLEQDDLWKDDFNKEFIKAYEENDFVKMKILRMEILN